MTIDTQVGGVEQKVRQRFAEIMHMPAGQLDLSAHLVEVYGLTSIQALKLISDVEVEFDVDIEQEEARGICTLADVITLIGAKNGNA